MIAQRVEFMNHFESQNDPKLMQKLIPKKLRTSCPKGTRWKQPRHQQSSQIDAKTVTEKDHEHYEASCLF